MNAAFLPPVALPSRPTFLATTTRVTCAARVARIARVHPLRMCEELSPAERTRRALSATEPLVKVRRAADEIQPEDTSFRYTNGTTPGGFDVWLIIGILTFIVPLVIFAAGVATGNIDVNPR